MRARARAAAARPPRAADDDADDAPVVVRIARREPDVAAPRDAAGDARKQPLANGKKLVTPGDTPKMSREERLRTWRPPTAPKGRVRRVPGGG